MVVALPWLIVLVTLLVFAPLCWAGFVWDDNLLIINNELTASWSNLPGLFTSALWDGTPQQNAPMFYRPLMVASLLVDRNLFGLSPAAHHAHSLLWHLAAVGLSWRLLSRWLPPLPLAVGLSLFAVHPLQVEAVAFVSSRNDPMAAVFVLLALLALCREAPAYIAAVPAIVAAGLCKESIFLAPLLYAAVELARTGRPGGLRGHLAIGAGLAVVAGMRFIAGIELPARADLDHLLAATPMASAYYASRLLVPVQLVPGLNLGWAPSVPWWALGMAAALAGGALWAGRRAALGGLLFAGASLAPAFAAIAHVAAVPDRYMYLPMLGLAMAVGAAARVAPRQAPMIAAAVAWLGFSALSSSVLSVWRDDRALWTAAHDAHQTAYTAGILARTLDLEGELDEAARLYAEATAPPRPFEEACYSITIIHLKRGDMAGAVQAGESALEAGCPASPELLSPLSVAYAREGRWDEAVSTANRVDIDPTGMAVVVRVAAGIRVGDEGPLQEALQQNPNASPEALMQAVQQLLAD